MTTKVLKLTLIQMNSSANNRDRNVAKALEYVKLACQRDNSDIIVLPEFFNREYFPQYRDYEYLSYAESDSDHTITRIRESAQAFKTNIIATIYEEDAPGVLFDSAMVINDLGTIIGKYRKVHAPAFKSLEKIYYTPGSRFSVFEIRGWRVGIIICYDTFFPEAARCLAVRGAELIVAPFAILKNMEIWESINRVRAQENGCYFASCNKVGKEGDWMMGGRSMVVDPLGRVVKTASEDQDEIFTIELQRSLIYEARKAWPMYRDRRPEVYRDIVKTYEEVRNLI